VFTASCSAFILAPGIIPYGATKNFTNHFAESLALELEDRLDILSYNPAKVATKMTGKKAEGFVISTDVAA
jgi:short-subunit dehydrogenase